MPHRQLGRDWKHRWSMLRTMVDQLIVHERIETTLPKAKELKPIAEKMVTLGKKGTISAIRRAEGILRTDEAMHKILYKLAPRYKDRHGGYVRVVARRVRRHDAAVMAYIEFVDRPDELRPAKPPATPPPPNPPLLPWVRSKFASITLPYRPSRAIRDPPGMSYKNRKVFEAADKKPKELGPENDGSSNAGASADPDEEKSG